MTDLSAEQITQFTQDNYASMVFARVEEEDKGCRFPIILKSLLYMVIDPALLVLALNLVADYTYAPQVVIGIMFAHILASIHMFFLGILARSGSGLLSEYRPAVTGWFKVFTSPGALKWLIILTLSAIVVCGTLTMPMPSGLFD